jgi:hypothetical protein
MKQVLFGILVAMLTTAGLCWAEGFQLTGKTESYTAKVTFLEGLPVKGSNKVRIDVVNNSSKSVKDAQVEIEYLMPSLSGKRPMMDYHAVAKRVSDAYEATLDLDMTGEWKMILSVTRAKHTEKATVGFVIK